MTERIIPLIDARAAPVSNLVSWPETLLGAHGQLKDSRGRGIHDLRISVTDRCNFRCTYCMPASVFDKDYAFLPQSALLSFEEIERLTRLFVAHGVEKIRLTGGEPLLRKNIEHLVERLARLSTASGKPLEITLTTNASLLKRKAASLVNAGLRRVTVSLDAIDEAVFRAMNDVDFPVAQVLEGIEAADAAGLRPLKINMVVKRGVNDHQIIALARHFKGTGHIVRFIEFMDVGSSNGWRMDDVVPSREVIERLDQTFGLTSLEPNYPGPSAGPTPMVLAKSA
jgi:GTP 3',8-cyclase